ncbi:MAG: LysM peptidoglycan-binding domain-containing protein [Chloroflexi bacterium]|nr:LysM peptidoglycan-binding domain-containing protein [Chloroflexota bacterium]
MTDLRRVWRFILAAGVGCWLCGCFPVTENALNEQKDPHFLAGKARLNSLDYQGAIDCFEKALEVNPRSASAHFELGVLYEQKENDYPAAIYHYEKHLRLRPNSDLAEVVRQRSAACKLEVAKTVSFGVVTREVQRDLDRLAAENAVLRQQVEALKAQLAQRASIPANAPTTGPAPVGTNALAQQNIPASRTVPPNVEQRTAAPSAIKAPPPTQAPRTHVVKSGDNPTIIARKYGITVSVLMAANPGLDARKLKIGQVLTIPAPKS